ncbi:hypothetical protein V6S02_11950 [Microbacterium sp. CCNWLW134]|uniref:hypothetical protein n=1 Tax=Microbacterium sp. CCNWLW134 TaxID=3122064 RepID=UPI0030102E6E
MITATGAGVVATIIPIGLAIIGFEIRNVPKPYATHWMGAATIWVTGVILFAALLVGFFAEWLLILSATSGEDLGGFSAVVVWIALWLIGWGSFLLLLGSLMDHAGLLERIGRGARERTDRSPRRAARRDAYLQTHYPEDGR